ncbi:MAG: hypothetical protein MUE78_12445 [Ilumatobacteraceae bacterium]|jgi:hypothetical protein|nr:hypothetical protein [Ilumatobacteraceae bacterium]
MIICKECGNQNADDDQFCGSCSAFLEWSGEKIVEDVPEPEPEPEVEAEKAGIVTRIKHAISGDDLPPPSGAAGTTPGTLPSPGGAPATGPAPGAAPAAAASTAAAATTAASAAATTADDKAAALVATPTSTEAKAPEARVPQAQTPQPTRARPKPVKQPPSRKINPGDLVCGACGEGNDPSRNYCRRCGTSLAEVVPVKRKWWQRKPKEPKVVAAGTRPGQPGRSGTDVGKQGRLVAGKASSGLSNARRVLALLAIVGIGTAIVIPSTRSLIFSPFESLYNTVRRTVAPEYETIALDSDRATATSGDGTLAFDSNTLTFWLPEAAPASVTIAFVEPSDVEHVLFHNGQQSDGGKVDREQPRPRTVRFVITKTDGQIVEQDAEIADEDGFQTIKIEEDDVVSVTTMIGGCYPDPAAIQACAITELEFQRVK